MGDDRKPTLVDFRGKQNGKLLIRLSVAKLAQKVTFSFAGTVYLDNDKCVYDQTELLI